VSGLLRGRSCLGPFRGAEAFGRAASKRFVAVGDSCGVCSLQSFGRTYVGAGSISLSACAPCRARREATRTTQSACRSGNEPEWPRCPWSARRPDAPSWQQTPRQAKKAGRARSVPRERSGVIKGLIRGAVGKHARVVIGCAVIAGRSVQQVAPRVGRKVDVAVSQGRHPWSSMAAARLGLIALEARFCLTTKMGSRRGTAPPGPPSTRRCRAGGMKGARFGGRPCKTRRSAASVMEGVLRCGCGARSALRASSRARNDIPRWKRCHGACWPGYGLVE